MDLWILLIFYDEIFVNRAGKISLKNSSPMHCSIFLGKCNFNHFVSRSQISSVNNCKKWQEIRGIIACQVDLTVYFEFEGNF